MTHKARQENIYSEIKESSYQSTYRLKIIVIDNEIAYIHHHISACCNFEKDRIPVQNLLHVITAVPSYSQIIDRLVILLHAFFSELDEVILQGLFLATHPGLGKAEQQHPTATLMTFTWIPFDCNLAEHNINRPCGTHIAGNPMPSGDGHRFSIAGEATQEHSTCPRIWSRIGDEA